MHRTTKRHRATVSGWRVLVAGALAVALSLAGV